MIHIVHVSTGAASAVALFRVLERYGAENTRAMFADVQGEDADNYRFLDDIERVSGFKVTRLIDGRTIWDVFMQHATLTTPGRGCRATWALKIQPLAKFREAINATDQTTVHIGLTIDEDDRRARFTKVMDPQPVDFPCTWAPLLWRCDIMDDLRRRGIEPPRLYETGYPHANCGGACILAGTLQWSGVLKDNPALFAEHEAKEQAFLQLLRDRGREERTILKDRRGSILKNYSLRQLREDLEQGRRPPDDSWRQTSCSCTLGF